MDGYLNDIKNQNRTKTATKLLRIVPKFDSKIILKKKKVRTIPKLKPNNSTYKGMR